MNKPEYMSQGHGCGLEVPPKTSGLLTEVIADIWRLAELAEDTTTLLGTLRARVLGPWAAETASNGSTSPSNESQSDQLSRSISRTRMMLSEAYELATYLNKEI